MSSFIGATFYDEATIDSDNSSGNWAVTVPAGTTEGDLLVVGCLSTYCIGNTGDRYRLLPAVGAWPAVFVSFSPGVGGSGGTHTFLKVGWDMYQAAVHGAGFDIAYARGGSSTVVYDPVLVVASFRGVTAIVTALLGESDHAGASVFNFVADSVSNIANLIGVRPTRLVSLWGGGHAADASQVPSLAKPAELTQHAYHTRLGATGRSGLYLLSEVWASALDYPIDRDGDWTDAGVTVEAVSSRLIPSTSDSVSGSDHWAWM